MLLLLVSIGQRIYYIHKDQMFDLYHAIVPLFSIITLLNFIALKLALKDNVTLSKILLKKQVTQLINKQSEEKNQTLAMMKFLLVNFTPIEFFSVRRAKYKIGFFLALSIVTIASYYLQSAFATAPLGSVAFMIYFVLGFVINKTADQENQQQSKMLREQYFQTGLSVIILVINMIVIGLVFKNYQNSVLTTFITNFSINSVLDNFLLRPLTLVLISIPLGRSETFITYMKECNKSLKCLELYEQIGSKQMLINRQKRDSPNKNTNKIQLSLQIQPMPFQQVIQVQQQIDQQIFNNALAIFKKIENQSIQPPMNINLDKQIQCEVSLDSLFNANKKQQSGEPVQKHLFQQISEYFPNEQIADKDIYSDNLVVVNPCQHKQIENEQEDVIQQIIKKNIVEQNIMSSQNQETDRKNQLTSQPEQQNAIARISLHSSIQSSSKRQHLIINLNNEFNLEREDQHQQFEQEILMDNFKRKQQFITIDQNSNRNAHGVLQIKEQNMQQRQLFDQIEEIDLNSPERRRRQIAKIELENIEQRAKLEVAKRKKKRLSYDHGHNRVLKFTTGQPYLEYLPHMLEKESKSKKSQSINKKDVITDHRSTNTGKKTKQRLALQQNNENMVHVFRIQDL